MLKEPLAAVKDKDFIFMPINDSLITTDPNYLKKGGSAGRHWTLLFVGCRGPAIKGWHYNSMSRLGVENVEECALAGI